MQKIKFLNLFLAAVPVAFSLYGCAGAPPVMAPPLQQGISGIYHRVERGETLWRISKTYNVDLEELARANRIMDTTSIEVGQSILIPGARVNKRALPAVSSDDDFLWPVRGRVICGFNQTYGNMINKGVNIKPYDSREIYVARSGKVVFYSPNFKAFGKTIIVDHQDGFSTVYSGNSDSLVKVGDYVRKGQAIGKLSGSFLHFEIRKGYVPQNPTFYLSN